MASYLDEIIKDKHSVVAEEERRESLEDIKSKILDLPPRRGFIQSIQQLSLIHISEPTRPY